MSAPDGDASAKTKSEEASNASSTVLREEAVDQPSGEISQWLRPDAPEPVREMARSAERAIDGSHLVSATYTSGPYHPLLSSSVTKRRIPVQRIASYGWPNPNKNCARG